MNPDTILSLPDHGAPGAWLITVIKALAGLSLAIFGYQVFAPKLRILFSDSVDDEARMTSLRDRARARSEHGDDRDLSAKLQDSLHASGDDPFAEREEQYLPGLGPMPTEWHEPKPPEAG